MGRFEPLNSPYFLGSSSQHQIELVLLPLGVSAVVMCFTLVLLPQQRILSNIRDAYCAGNLDWVHASDPLGLAHWAPTQAFGANANPGKWSFGHLLHGETTFAHGIFLGVVQNSLIMSGCENTGSTFFCQDIYNVSDGVRHTRLRTEAGNTQGVGAATDSALAGQRQASSQASSLDVCCTARLTVLPAVFSGRFSIAEVQKQSPPSLMAMFQWFGCADFLDHEYNEVVLLRGSIGDAVDLQPCGGACPRSHPFCHEGQCIVPTCGAVKEAGLCESVGDAGIRARRWCGVTCGCNDPFSSLAYRDGCPSVCSTESNTALSRHFQNIAECVDTNMTDPSTGAVFREYLTSLDHIIASWPVTVHVPAWNWPRAPCRPASALTSRTSECFLRTLDHCFPLPLTAGIEPLVRHRRILPALRMRCPLERCWHWGPRQP